MVQFWKAYFEFARSILKQSLFFAVLAALVLLFFGFVNSSSSGSQILWDAARRFLAIMIGGAIISLALFCVYRWWLQSADE